MWKFFPGEEILPGWEPLVKDIKKSWSPLQVIFKKEKFFLAEMYGKLQMTSVERIHDYHHLPEEEVLGEKPSVSLPNWPENGSITFADFSYAYYESGPLVLRNINLEIKSKEKAS